MRFLFILSIVIVFSFAETFGLTLNADLISKCALVPQNGFSPSGEITTIQPVLFNECKSLVNILENQTVISGSGPAFTGVGGTIVFYEKNRVFAVSVLESSAIIRYHRVEKQDGKLYLKTGRKFFGDFKYKKNIAFLKRIKEILDK